MKDNSESIFIMNKEAISNVTMNKEAISNVTMNLMESSILA